MLEAPDGRAAMWMAAAWDGPIDLLVSEVEMPHMSGPELARKLSEDRRMGVLYLSPHAESTTGRTGLRDDGHPLLPKPFDARELARIAGALLSGYEVRVVPAEALPAKGSAAANN